MNHWHHNPGRVRQAYDRLRAGWVGAACLGGDASPRVVFPGAFNPLHLGHRRMAETAARRLRAPVHFELSLLNVDKPPLTAESVSERCQHFSRGDALWLTKAPTFVEKSRLFPGAWFVIGIDTLHRIVDPLYYGDQVDQRDRALGKILKKECQFLVFGRVVHGRFLSLADVDLPTDFADHCREVPEADFREDVSSTEVRTHSRGNSPSGSEEML